MQNGGFLLAFRRFRGRFFAGLADGGGGGGGIRFFRIYIAYVFRFWRHFGLMAKFPFGARGNFASGKPCSTFGGCRDFSPVIQNY